MDGDDSEYQLEAKREESDVLPKRQRQPEEMQEVSRASSGRKRDPNEEDLCQALYHLRRKFPQRSIEQIIIRMHHSVEHKMDADGSSLRSSRRTHRRRRQTDAVSECSRAEDFEDDRSFRGGYSFDNTQELEAEPSHMKLTSEEGKAPEREREEEQPGWKESKVEAKRKGLLGSEGGSETGGSSYPDEYIPEAGYNYIYRPRGAEVVMELLEINTRKFKFINIEDEARYLERRTMAKSFVERGYGVGDCRKEIEAEGLPVEMHRNTYKTLASSVIILAYRKLESFIANECGKTVKCLDRWQMRALCTPMLNCRTCMEPELTNTLFKFIRASYGIGNVRIGEVESVKLYLCIQKLVYGKNVTMETLERMGEIQYKKNIELTLEHLNRKKMRRESRISHLRRLKLDKKYRKRQVTLRGRNQPATMMVESGYPGVSGIREPSVAASLKLEDQAPPTTPRQQESQGPQSEGGSEVKREEEAAWTGGMDLQLAEIYVHNQDLNQVPQLMKGKHPCLVHWTLQMFLRRFTRLVKKAVKRVQVESQCAEDPARPVLNRLSKEQLRRLSRTLGAESVRVKLLNYFILAQPNLELLYLVVDHTNNFLKESMAAEVDHHHQQSEDEGEPPNEGNGPADQGFFSRQPLGGGDSELEGLSLGEVELELGESALLGEEELDRFTESFKMTSLAGEGEFE